MLGTVYGKACGGEKQPAAEESKTETTEPAATEEKAEDKAGEDAKKVEAEVTGWR